MSDKGNATQQEAESHKESQPPENRIRDRSVLPDWAIVVLTAVMIGVMAWQTWLVEKQGIDAGKQTDRIIAANERLAKGMEDSVSQSKVAMDSSLEQSRKALDATLEVGRADKRAYITLVRFSGPQRLGAGEEIRTDLIWKNSGKTAARRVEPDCHFWTQLPGPPQEPPHTKPTGVGSPAELGPSQRLQSFPAYRVNSGDWADIASARKLVFIHATLDYEDIFRQRWQAYIVAQYERDGWTAIDIGTKHQPHAEE